MIATFVEFRDEIDAVLDYIRKNNLKDEEYMIFALTLDAQIYLKQKDTRYCNTLEFFKNKSHEKCLIKSNEIVKFLEDNINFKKNPEKINGYKDWYMFLVRHVTNYLLCNIEVISNILKNKNYKTVISFNYKGNNLFREYLHKIIKNILEIKKIRSIEIELEEQENCKVNDDKDKNYKELSKNVEKTNKKKILITSFAYGMNGVISKIKKWDNDIEIIYVHENRLNLIEKVYYKVIKGADKLIFLEELIENPKYMEITDDLEEIEKILRDKNEIFEYDGINFWEYVNKEICESINEEIKKLVKKSNKMSFLINKLKPELTLSFSSRNLTYNLGEICKNNGLEALCISHGTVVPPKNDIEEIVNRNIGKSVILNKYPSVAVQTPWCEKFLRHYKHPSKDVITGNLLFKDNIKKIEKTEKIILHAVTLKPKHALKFFGVENHDEFLSSIISLIEAVEKIPNTRLIIQLHPAYKHMFDPEELKILLPKSNSYELEHKKKINDNLSRANLVVSFSSTVIEQATINRIPVLLYDKWGRYKHFDAVELGKDKLKPYPVYYANNEMIMKNNLKKILSIESKNINEKDWLEYTYPKEYKEYFYKYLEEIFQKR